MRTGMFWDAPIGANSAVLDMISTWPDDIRLKLWNGSSIASPGTGVRVKGAEQ